MIKIFPFLCVLFLGLVVAAMPGRVALAGNHAASHLRDRDADRDNDHDSDQDRAREALREGRVVSLHRILEQVERDYSGKMIQVELEQKDTRYFYEVKLLADTGRLIKLRYDAHDATLLNGNDADVVDARRK